MSWQQWEYPPIKHSSMDACITGWSDWPAAAVVGADFVLGGYSVNLIG